MLLFIPIEFISSLIFSHLGNATLHPNPKHIALTV